MPKAIARAAHLSHWRSISAERAAVFGRAAAFGEGCAKRATMLNIRRLVRQQHHKSRPARSWLKVGERIPRSFSEVADVEVELELESGRQACRADEEKHRRFQGRGYQLWSMIHHYE